MTTPAKAVSSSTTGPEDDVNMSIFDHLRELRKRLVLALVGLIPGVSIAGVYHEELLDWYVAPFAAEFSDLSLGAPKLHFGTPGGLFIAYMKISLVVGILISAPWIFWQIWNFIAPGLYRREKRYALPFVLASSFCFAGGAYFGYEYIFPLCFRFFLEMAGALPSHNIQVEPTIMVGDYLAMANGMLIAFGAVFELPVVVSFLALIGLVTAKGMLKFGRWWIVIASIVSALLTPADPWSMFAVFIPLVVLYYFSVLLAWIFQKKEKETTSRNATGEGA